MSSKEQVLDDIFKFMESVKIKNDCSDSLGKRVYQVPVNFHIHLRYKMKEKINQGIDVRAGSLPECCVRCITVTGWQTQLLTDKRIVT